MTDLTANEHAGIPPLRAPLEVPPLRLPVDQLAVLRFGQAVSVAPRNGSSSGRRGNRTLKAARLHRLPTGSRRQSGSEGLEVIFSPSSFRRRMFWACSVVTLIRRPFSLPPPTFAVVIESVATSNNDSVRGLAPEQQNHNPRVRGSNPCAATFRIAEVNHFRISTYAVRSDVVGACGVSTCHLIGWIFGCRKLQIAPVLWSTWRAFCAKWSTWWSVHSGFIQVGCSGRWRREPRCRVNLDYSALFASVIFIHPDRSPVRVCYGAPIRLHLHDVRSRIAAIVWNVHAPKRKDCCERNRCRKASDGTRGCTGALACVRLEVGVP